MRLLYTLLLSSMLVCTGCSKDVLKSYDRRVIGTWKIIDIDRFGFNEPDALPFKETDVFTFEPDGILTIQKDTAELRGSWDIERLRAGDNDAKGLSISAIDFTNQQMRSEHFTNMQFTGTNRFFATINYRTRTYIYRFLRQ